MPERIPDYPPSVGDRSVFRQSRQYADCGRFPALPNDLQPRAGTPLAKLHVGSGGDMKIQQLTVIHLVNVIAAKDQNVIRVFALDRIDVLINGIGGTLIPLFGRAELRRYGE